MTLVLGLVGATIVVVVAAARMLLRSRQPSPSAHRDDVHWGDWPPDQMAP